MWDWIKRATTPTASRWGIVTLLIAISAILLAVRDMVAPIISLTFTVVGFILIALAVALIVIFLVTGSKETTATDIKAIRNILEKEQQQRQNIQVVLGVLDWLIGKFKK